MRDGFPDHTRGGTCLSPGMLGRASRQVNKRQGLYTTGRDCSSPMGQGGLRVSRRAEEVALLDRNRDLGRVPVCTGIRVACHRNRIVRRSVICEVTVTAATTCHLLAPRRHKPGNTDFMPSQDRIPNAVARGSDLADATLGWLAQWRRSHKSSVRFTTGNPLLAPMRISQQSFKNLSTPFFTERSHIE